jgi:hypothetical protein
MSARGESGSARTGHGERNACDRRRTDLLILSSGIHHRLTWRPTMTTLSDAALKLIAERIFVMGDRATTRLPAPTLHGSADFMMALDSIASDPNSPVKDAGIGVIDFTVDAKNPMVWLNNETTAFRIGSAGKIAMMVAAVQLRLDVRRILKLDIISKPEEFDELFRNKKLWRLAKAPQSEMQQIGGPRGTPPLFSRIFDFDQPRLDFRGPDPDGRTDVAQQDAILAKLPPVLPGNLPHLPWRRWTDSTGTPRRGWSDLTFSERLWLAGCMSDNVAATSCVSEIGVPYIKAVQRSYGLADPAHGMHLLASGGYDGIPPSARPPNVPSPRRLTYREPIEVKDLWWDKTTQAFSDRRSHVPGSAAALTAYMIALVADTFVTDPDALVGGLEGCRTIKNNLAGAEGHGIGSFLVKGVRDVPDTQIRKLHNKIGILKKGPLGTDSPESSLLCEFVYLETEQDPPPPPPPPAKRIKMKYAVVATGLIDDTTVGGLTAATKSRRLGFFVHTALLSLPP